MNGILLALQFFTVIPIKKELPLGRKEVTVMYIVLPFVGATIGLLMYAVFVLTVDYLNMGSLLVAVFITLTGIVLTGGLHLDGWADTADAFFSYKDRAKRLEILADSRLGAFGTMALVLLLIVKIALFNELLIRGDGVLLFFMIVPFLARVGLSLYFTTMRPAKETGIAYFFKKKLAERTVFSLSLLWGFVGLVITGFLTQNYVFPIVLFAMIAVFLLLFRRWSLKHFGGMTGDLSGALIEGMEVILWLVLFVLL